MSFSLIAQCGKKEKVSSKITPSLTLPQLAQPRFEHKHKNLECGGGGEVGLGGSAEKELIKTEPTPLVISLP